MFRICFIDDDDKFEIRLFRDVFGEDFDIVAATDYVGLKSRIAKRRGWTPDVFVLDLYFPSEPADRDAIEALRAKPLSLENDNADIRTAYRNYRRVAARLTSILGAWNQDADGGLRLAEKIAADYPQVPIVFYSRKATLEDVVRCMAARNVWGVVRKPTGNDSAETMKLTRSAKERIARRFETVIAREDPAKLKRIKQAADVLLEFLQDFDRSPDFSPHEDRKDLRSTCV